MSKKYSQEIQTTEFGFGLEGVLRTRSSTVTGILNGVDYDEWSPGDGQVHRRSLLAAGFVRQSQVQAGSARQLLAWPKPIRACR